MVAVHKIDSLDLPELAPYRTMRRPREHREQGLFVAEGEKVVRRLLESDYTVRSLLLPEKWFREYESLIRSRPEPISIYLAEKKILEELIGFSMFQGVLAVGIIPAPQQLDTLIEQSPHPQLFVAVEGLSNAENIGGMARNCAAFGVHGLLVDPASSSPFLRRAVRSSMGAIFRLPVVEGVPLTRTIPELRKRGIRCFAAHPRADSLALSRTDLSVDCCVVFGSEGQGISRPVLAACNEAVVIPMASGINSLNVVHAAAVFLYEINRQRGLG